MLFPSRLQSGHSLKCLVRDPSKLPEAARNNKQLEVVQGSVTDSSKVAECLSSCDDVFITLGGRGTNVCSEGTKVIMDEIKKAKMDPKTVVVTSFGTGDSREDADGYLIRFFMWAFLSSALADKEIQEQIIKDAGLSHWVIVRPGGLTNGPATGKWKAGKFKSSASQISRADVAAFSLKCFDESTEWKGQTPTLTSA